MDWKENEIREDLDKVRSMIDALRTKYDDEEFGCVFTAGRDLGEAWAGSVLVCGDSHSMHQVCHGLLEVPKFIDEMCDAMKCVLLQNSTSPEIIGVLAAKSVDSLKRLLIMRTKAYKKHMEEKEVDEAVDNLVQSIFGHNKEN